MMMMFSLILIPGLHDDDYLPVAYAGVWAIVDDPLAYGGAYHQTATGTFTFSFQGSAFALYGVQSTSGGTANICIDDDCVPASWSAADTIYSQIIAISGLDAYDTHTVTVTADDNGFINLDALYIAPVMVAPPAEPEAAPEWISISEDGTSATQRIFTTGDLAVFTVILALLIVNLVSVTLQIRRWA